MEGKNLSSSGYFDFGGFLHQHRIYFNPFSEVGTPFLNRPPLNRNDIIGAGTLLTLTNLKLYSLTIA